MLFLCVHNAGRSQMAARLASTTSPATASIVWSGGSEPGPRSTPPPIAAMAEVGIDIASEYPKPWTEEIVQAADVVVTMGCGDACPIFPGKRYEDWELDDPAGHGVDAVRPIRDEIRRRVETLIDSLELDPPDTSPGYGQRASIQSMIVSRSSHGRGLAPAGGSRRERGATSCRRCRPARRDRSLRLGRPSGRGLVDVPHGRPVRVAHRTDRDGRFVGPDDGVGQPGADRVGELIVTWPSPACRRASS